MSQLLFVKALSGKPQYGSVTRCWPKDKRIHKMKDSAYTIIHDWSDSWHKASSSCAAWR
jgi:hypothetical protein